jgi:hypothetical protein
LGTGFLRSAAHEKYHRKKEKERPGCLPFLHRNHRLVYRKLIESRNRVERRELGVKEKDAP